MSFHTFTARTFPEALRQVRAELGPDASVLHTREIPSPLGRWLGGTLIEVTASVEIAAPSRLEIADGEEEPESGGVSRTRVISGRIPAAELENFRRAMREQLLAAADDESSLVEQLAAAASPHCWTCQQWHPPSRGAGVPPAMGADRGAGVSPAAPDNLHCWTSQQWHPSVSPAAADSLHCWTSQQWHPGISQGHPQLAARGISGDLPVVRALRQRLKRAGISEQLAEGWLERLAAELACDPECHPDRTTDRLRQIIAGDLPIAGPVRISAGRTQVLALVGPTGVGKTTTLAKLASHFRLVEKRSVALISCDTFRIAAADQLRAYAEILDVPMEVAGTPEQLRAALARADRSDLVLIDTAGRSPHDGERLAELRDFVAAARPDTVHLVQSCAADAASTLAARRAFAAAGADRLILTKLDEAGGPAAAIGHLPGSPLAVSYVADGQNVPADLRPASAIELADAILRPC